MAVRTAVRDDDADPTPEQVLAYLERARIAALGRPERQVQGERGRRGPRGRNARRYA